MSRIDEITRKQLVADVDGWTKDKTKKVRRAVYKGITPNYTCYFLVPSVTTQPPTKYTVRIRMTEYNDIKDEKDLTVQEKVRLALAGELKISCNCPAFLYFGYKYILTQVDANASDDEHRFPKIRNPKLNGVMCKHCYKAIQAFPFNWNSIARDIEKENFLRE